MAVSVRGAVRLVGVVVVVLQACGGNKQAGSDASGMAGTAGGAGMIGAAGTGSDAAAGLSGGGGSGNGADGGADTAGDRGGDLPRDAALDMSTEVGVDGPREAGADAAVGKNLFALAARYVGHFGTQLCDVNGDGRLDLVSTSPAGAGVPNVWRGHGDGTFDDAAVVSSASTVIFDSAAGTGNFDGDGRCDLLYVRTERDLGKLRVSAGVAHGNADGTFSANVARALTFTATGQLGNARGPVADVTGDGLSDLMYVGATVAGTFEFVLIAGVAAGGGADVAVTEVTTGVPTGVGSSVSGGADVDKDGVLDVLVGGGDGAAVIYGAGGPSLFGARHDVISRTASARALVDLDGDGRADPVVGLTAGRPQIVWSNANGTFTPGPLDLHGSYGAVGDFDADGRPDVADASLAVTVSFGDGARGFGRTRTLPRTPSMLAGDVDGDGVPDIIATTSVEGVSMTSVYVSTAKHPAPPNPFIQCGTLTPAACAGLPTGF